MAFSLRARLLAIVGSTALAMLIIVAASIVVTRSVEDQLVRIQDQEIPKLELGPRLVADFGALKRSYQDAVAARDPEALDRTREIKDRMLAEIDSGRAVLDAEPRAAFTAALGAYTDAAVEVSRSMIAGRGGEDIVDQMAAMQKKQARAQELLDRLAVFDERDLKGAFGAVREAQAAGARARLVVMVLCLGFILVLTVRTARSVVDALSRLEGGLARFGEGTFDRPIPSGSAHTELDRVAREANRMAESLAKAAIERELRDWIKTGMMDLDAELRGELDEEEVARRAVRSLARLLGAPAGALYSIGNQSEIDPVRPDAEPRLRLLGHHALSQNLGDDDAATSFVVGEGLVGEAARGGEIVVLADPPEGFFRLRSGLGSGPPRCLVLVPLLVEDKVTGVLELALFKPLSAEQKELLASARGAVAVALAVAKSREATRWLLGKTQQQAARLTAQEEELKATNEELRCQQEELRQTNDILAEQRSAVEARNRDLQEIGRRLSQKASELTSVSAYKSQFLANMSHELRTPLNSMLLLSKLLADNAEGRLSTKQVEYARTVHSAGRDLLELINQVLDLAKVESGKQEVNLAAVKLDEVADRMRRTFRPLADDKGLALDVVLDPDVPQEITSDPQRVVQIVTNLLGNAIKFTDRGWVKLTIGRRKETIAFVVSDTGPGIAAEHRARIFAPFEQVQTPSKGKATGTGLGLSISRELAKLLGGDLTLEHAAEGSGSTFVLVLPASSAQKTQKTERPAAVAPRPVAPPPIRQEADQVHLLVIEDDPVFAEILGDIIRERGLVHVTASDGQAGLRLARELHPRGIILDVKLPDLDGWRVMELLRDDPETTSIPVHFITGVDMADRGYAMGATGYLVKPPTRADLVRLVDAFGSRENGPAARLLVVESANGELSHQLAQEGFSVARAMSADQAMSHLEQERFACMIVDLAEGGGGELELLERLKDPAGEKRQIPAVVVYASRPLRRAEAMRLESYAEAVVLKEGASAERLLDEIRLFVRRLEAGLPARPAPPADGVDVRLEGRRLLVVDDDMRTVYALSATLRAKGADVVVAENGAIALGVLRETPEVDAVLMDMMMPEMDGYEAMRRIRAQPRFAKLPIIALTAKAMTGDRERCIEAGASDYLPKPIDPDALLRLLGAKLSLPAPAT